MAASMSGQRGHLPQVSAVYLVSLNLSVCQPDRALTCLSVPVCLSGGQSCCSRDVLKVGVSVMTSALFFPFLVWGGFVFLPFDAPVLDGAALRLVYTLRCSVFATAPIVFGEDSASLSHLCAYLTYLSPLSVSFVPPSHLCLRMDSSGHLSPPVQSSV